MVVRIVVFYRVVGKSFVNKRMFEQRTRGSEGMTGGRRVQVEGIASAQG